ncbi:Bacterial mobilisation protein (MobC) [Oligella urethralis]|uniref:Bacterial mobilisation protein (MobC) n=2 Tax=Oligella urethralis TaxID=90245 RepID=A0A2X1VKZ0_9BURK|nr:Bacterial mobilisation protein (MobC) [Oligella urethralis]
MPRIYGLSETTQEQLRQIAKEKTGKASVSALAKHLLIEQLKTSPVQKYKYRADAAPNVRFEVRVPEATKQVLLDHANALDMTINQFSSMIIQKYVHDNPILSTLEIERLYQSNQQLLAIGRNLNQIARALNANQSTSLSLKFLQELEETITQHTQKVGHIISNNWDRMP